MAELQDTSGVKPQLKRYQSKGLNIKDAPVRDTTKTVESSDAKMWDSISEDLQHVTDVGNKMRRLALEDEKVKISADMQSHYIDATTTLSNGMKSQSNEQLTGFKNLYGSGSLGGSYKDLKPYKVDESKYSKKAQEEMSPFIELAEKKFHADAMKLHFGELIARSDDQLSLMETKSLAGLSVQLEEAEEMKDTSETFDMNGKKVKKVFAFLREGKIDNQKAIAANNLLRPYVQLLHGKVGRNLMRQSDMDLRIYNYAQKLGEVQFKHYQGIDEDKALDLAINKGIVLDPGIIKGVNDHLSDDDRQSVYNDPNLATYINQARIREISELETNKRNIHLQEQKLLYQDKGAEAWLNGIGRAFDPDALKIEKGIKTEWTPDEINGVGNIKQVTTTSKRKYTPAEQEARMNTMAEVIFKTLGKGSGFTSAAHVKSAYMGMVLDAKGEKEQYIKFQRTEYDRRKKEYLGRMRAHFANVRQNPDKEKRFQVISHAFEVDPRNNTWKPKQSYIEELMKHGGIKEKDARTFMLTVTPGISTRSPGGGLGPSGMKNLQNALATYYQNKLFVKDGTNYNPDPMQLEITLRSGKTQKLKDEYNLYQLNHDERTLLANQRNEYEEIINFDKDGITLKSTQTLTDKWKDILKNQGSDTAQRSRAMSAIGDTYANTILIPRIEAVLNDPNGTFLKDMDIVFDPTEGVTDNMKQKLNERWKLTGEANRPIGAWMPSPENRGQPGWESTGSGGGRYPVYIYIPKEYEQKSLDPFIKQVSELKKLTPKHQITKR